MSELVLAVWEVAPMQPIEAVVLPDGCRDLIMGWAPGERPHWFVSPLAQRPDCVSIGAGIVMRGFRLQPGVRLNEAALVDSVQGRDWAPEDILARIGDHGDRAPQVAEALACLASGVASVSQAAGRLGVGQRTLQRLLMDATGQAPSTWLQLARARQAARAVLAPGSIAELADAHRYADQAHMTREFRRWFGTTPRQLRRSPVLAGLLTDSGYG